MQAGRRQILALALAGATACTVFVETDDLSETRGADASAPTAQESGPAPDLTNDAATDPYRAAVLADDPRAYWRLGEPAGAALAKDEVGANDGRYVATSTGEPGLVAGRSAARFDGGSSRVELDGTAFGYFFRSSFTVEAWAAPTTRDGCRHIFTRQQRFNPKRGYALAQLGNDGIFLERWVADDGRSSREGAPFHLATDRFTHVVGVYANESLFLYLDGELAQSGGDTRGLAEHVAGAFIGSAGASGECVFEGRLAEVAVYAKALTPARIRAHFTAAR